MTPREIAADDGAWRHYVHWLTHFRVAPDRTQALMSPAHWAELNDVDPDNVASLDHLTIEERLLVVAWTWPDRRLDRNYDAYREVVLDPVEDTRLDERRARTMSALLGPEFLATVGLVAHTTGTAADDVVGHVLFETGMSVEHWELLTLGRARIDVDSLIAISRALNLRFDQDWEIEDPTRLRARIERSASARRLIELLSNIAQDDLRRLAEAAEVARVDDPDADVDPAAFHHRLMYPGRWRGARRARERDEPDRCKPPRKTSKYFPLFLLLDQTDELDPTYPIDDLDREVGKGGRVHDKRTKDKPGLPPDAWTAQWWRNGPSVGHPQVRAWQGSGYLVKEYNSATHEVTFTAMKGRHKWWLHRQELRAGTYRPHRVPAQQLYSLRRWRLDVGYSTRAGHLARKHLESHSLVYRYAGARHFQLYSNPRDGVFFGEREGADRSKPLVEYEVSGLGHADPDGEAATTE